MPTNQSQSPDSEIPKISELFGENVFDLHALKSHVDPATYEQMTGVILKQEPLRSETAGAVAQGLIEWAMSKGATHFTHWFHPLTDSSAEKHDAFFQPSLDLEAKGIESLTGARLLQQEPDGSSFPSGGIRVTHQARSYTVWDPSSPPFILETDNGKTLYIPAVFVSYTGEALDYKTPLLKANHALNQAATAVCKLLGEPVKHVFSTLGWEQEYFLVDEEFVHARPDLLLFGRTIFGGKSAKGQEMDDHYFGPIPVRVQDFMRHFERESLKLGIPIVTRHNEVAPGQFECAPVFEEANVAVDHNLLIMELMKRVAIEHGLRVLMHEKPFAGLNGNGKHNNWSLATDSGQNLLKPGDAPGENLLFLTFFINVLAAVADHNDLVRASIASAGNDHRLGANEAPPAIISAYVGAQLDAVLARFKVDGLVPSEPLDDQVIDLGLTKIHPVSKDPSDRNRTSPFAFIGNRFELRAVGASANCAGPMTVINSIVAKQLRDFAAEVESRTQAGTDPKAAAVATLQSYMGRVERVIFNGNGYSKEWETQAAERGLSNHKTTPPALAAMVSDRAVELFGELGVFTERELHARREVQLENYVNKIAMESLLFQELSRTFVLPAAFEMINRLGTAHEHVAKLSLAAQAQSVSGQIEAIATLAAELDKGLEATAAAQARADALDDPAAKAAAYCDEVRPLFDRMRASIDQLEGRVDDGLWNLPKYRELLFIR